MRWLITLQGEEGDLQRLLDWPDGDDWQIVRDKKRGVILCGRRLDALGDHAAVRRAANDLIEAINRAACFTQPAHKAVGIAGLVERTQAGDNIILTVDDAVHAVDSTRVTIRLHSHMDAVLVDYEEIARNQTEQAYATLVKLLEINPDLAAALRYFQGAQSMADYFKAVEAIRDAVGRKRDILVRLGWTSKAELRRFTQSTQPDRHHKGRGPSNPMSPGDARSYVHDLLDKLIPYLDAQHTKASP